MWSDPYKDPHKYDFVFFFSAKYNLQILVVCQGMGMFTLGLGSNLFPSPIDFLSQEFCQTLRISTVPISYVKKGIQKSTTEEYTKKVGPKKENIPGKKSIIEVLKIKDYDCIQQIRKENRSLSLVYLISTTIFRLYICLICHINFSDFVVVSLTSSSQLSSLIYQF